MMIMILVSVAILGPVIAMCVWLPEVTNDNCYITQDNRPLANKQLVFTRSKGLLVG
jgi:hypothetical protein